MSVHLPLYLMHFLELHPLQMTPAAKQRTEILQLLGLPFQIFATKGNTIKIIIICCKFFFFFIGQLHVSYNSYMLACVQTELNCWLSQSVKQRQNPSSVSLPVYQDLNMFHDWTVQKTITDMQSGCREILHVFLAICWVCQGPRTRFLALLHRCY